MTIYRVDKIALKLPRKSKEAVKHRIHLLEVYQPHLVAEHLLNSDFSPFTPGYFLPACTTYTVHKTWLCHRRM